MSKPNQREILEFVHDANVERFTTLLAVTDNEDERRLLRTLLAEEMARSRSRPPEAGQH